LILRLCEFRGKVGAVEIGLPGWVKDAWQVNLLEREGEALPVENQRVKQNLHPWEIATLKLNP
jgi:alpha-mannosidase